MTLKISCGQRLLHFLLLRQLCQNDGTEDQHTAKQFLKTQSLSQQYPASQYREHGLQTEKQGGYRRICIFLRYDLQGIRHSAGHYTGIKHWLPCLQDLRKHRLLPQQSWNCTDDRSCQKLDRRHFHAIHFR